MPKYPRLPRSVYVQRVETVKHLGPWNGLGKLSPHCYYRYVISLVYKPGIHEIWNFKLNLTMKILNQGLLQLWSKCDDLR